MRDETKSVIEKITGDNRRPGMDPTHTHLVRYNSSPRFGWLCCATFATRAEAESFADSLMNAAQDLIDRSISHNEIAHGEYDAGTAAELSAASENGGTRNDRVTEYWGVTDDGDEWRVHLDHEDDNAE